MLEEIRILKGKFIWQLTGEELVTLLKYENVYVSNCNKKAVSANRISDEKLVYGLKGIAKLFGCSISSAMRLKRSGKINDAIVQDGRKIIVDVEKALILIKSIKAESR